MMKVFLQTYRPEMLTCIPEISIYIMKINDLLDINRTTLRLEDFIGQTSIEHELFL